MNTICIETLFFPSNTYTGAIPLKESSCIPDTSRYFPTILYQYTVILNVFVVSCFLFTILSFTPSYWDAIPSPGALFLCHRFSAAVGLFQIDQCSLSMREKSAILMSLGNSLKSGEIGAERKVRGILLRSRKNFN